MSTKPLTRIAIVGASGRIGGAFARALLQTGQHTVTALTRPGGASNASLPAGVVPVEVDYDSESALVAALQGQQFLAITLSVSAPPDLHARICAAAGKAGVKYVMPNAYGFPSTLPGVGEKENGGNDQYADLVRQRVADVEANGVSKPLLLACGLWYEWSLACGEQWFGFTIKDRKVTMFDDGKRVLTVSTWDQCGRALAGLLSLPETAAEGPSVEGFAGKELLISSFRVSQRDMLNSLHRVLGTTDEDWEIRYETTEKRIRDGAEELKAGDFRGFAKGLYGRAFSPANKLADFAGSHETHNEILGLSGEDLDEATKRTVDMVESGWTPFPQGH
ncbi:hypothetical protein VTI74DRAFT_8915 [Chaetomium olivicolor]